MKLPNTMANSTTMPMIWNMKPRGPPRKREADLGC
jgi:hypothetical protein